jgi:hypothetical protein
MKDVLAGLMLWAVVAAAVSAGAFLLYGVVVSFT